MKNPYLYFTSDYYSTTQIDELVYNITVSGVTQQQLDDAIVTFRTSDEIDISYSADTSTFLTTDEIEASGSAYTEGFIDSDTINTKIAGFVTEFLISSEIDPIFSAHTSELLTEAEAQIYVNSGVNNSMEYWYTAPYYERTFFTDLRSYSINYPLNSEVEVYISGNTYWEVTSSPATWLSVSISEGIGFSSITLVASQNSDSGSRQTSMTFDADDVVETPWTILITQAGNTTT